MVMRILPKFLHMSAILMLLTGSLAWKSAQAGSFLSCQWFNPSLSTWSAATPLEFLQCAVLIGSLGANNGLAQSYGRWGIDEFVVKNNGDAYWSKSGKFATRLPDSDYDGILYDRCPAKPESYNKVFDTDGCPDTLQDLITLATTDLNQFWSQQFALMKRPYMPPNRVRGYTQICGMNIANNAIYCLNEHSIYYDYAFLEKWLGELGDFAPVTILAHEWGHLVQRLLGITKGYKLDPQTGTYLSIDVELQADCLAGVYAHHLATGGSTLVHLDVDDIQEGAWQAYNVGDPWWIEREDIQAHGKPEERFDAFLAGYNSGIAGCFE